jgi:hypothetical protein
VHTGAVDRAAKKLFEGDQPVAVVEVQAAYLNPSDRQRHPQTDNLTDDAEIACFEAQNRVTQRQTTTGKDAIL